MHSPEGFSFLEENRRTSERDCHDTKGSGVR
jgi:hypothetical protein